MSDATNVFPSAKEMRTQTLENERKVQAIELKDVLVQLNEASSKGLYSCETYAKLLAISRSI